MSNTIIKNCLVCGAPFPATMPNRIYCSYTCKEKAHRQRIRSNPQRRAKQLEQQRNYNKKYALIRRQLVETRAAKAAESNRWIKEAAECGMSYGKYRAAIEKLGKTFEELRKNFSAPDNEVESAVQKNELPTIYPPDKRAKTTRHYRKSSQIKYPDEKYLPIPSLDNRYEISKSGYVRNAETKINIPLQINTSGKSFVPVVVGGKRTTRTISKLIAEVWSFPVLQEHLNRPSVAPVDIPHKSRRISLRHSLEKLLT